MSTTKTSFPSRQAAAARNREKILDAARAAFADGTADVSMAEVARAAGVGMATLYRNFASRRELVEALYSHEVDELCAAAETDARELPPAAALEHWLRRLLDFLPGKQMIISDLRRQPDTDEGFLGRNRARALDAGRPLLRAAQDAGRVRAGLEMEHVFDLVIAIARTDGDSEYVAPIAEIMLAGLFTPARDDRT